MRHVTGATMQRQERFSGLTMASPSPALPRQNTGAQWFLLGLWWIALF